MQLSDISPVLVTTGLVWIAAEATKYLVGRLHDRHRKLFDSGGMPSVHTAVIVGCTTAIGLSEGVGSPLFALAAVVSAIVAHDSFRVRWLLGETAARANELSKAAKLRPLPVFRGHRIREIVAGGIYGSLLAWGIWQLVG
jgi:uncharacterized protein